MTAIPVKGGPVKCPRPCSECSDEHHFSDAYIDCADDAPDAEPAKLGHATWYVCKHCPAWIEWETMEDLIEAQDLRDRQSVADLVN